MNLKTVTLTGADESTKVDDLVALQKEYPFVEFGFLLSMGRQGKAPRYPALSYLQEIGESELNKSVHLCGKLARESMFCNRYALETALQLVKGTSRIQINLGKGIDKHPDLFDDMHHQIEDKNLYASIIIQTYSFNTDAVLKSQKSEKHDRVYPVSFLHDASGGLGISGDFEPPINDTFVGFAGGITPENVEQKLAQVNYVIYNNTRMMETVKEGCSYCGKNPTH